jgi:hypothetical protein
MKTVIDHPFEYVNNFVLYWRIIQVSHYLDTRREETLF